MKTLVLTLGLLLFFSTSNAQKYHTNDRLLSAGIRYATLNNEVPKYDFIPINLSLENIFIDKWVDHKMAVGGGIEAGYFKYILGPRIYEVKQLSLILDFHYTFNRQFEVYAGVLPGYYFDSYENTSIDHSGMDGFNNQFMLGARYFIIPALGVYTRMLINDYGAEAGLTFRF